MGDRRQQEMPRYGVDAPGVVIGFFAAAGGAIVIAAILVRYFNGWLAIAGAGLLAVGLIALSFGVSMLLYSYFGKQRFRDYLLRQRTWRGDEMVLDLGAGRGLMAVGAALRVPRGRVVALDVWSAKDLTGNTPEALRRNAEIEGVQTRVEIVTGDARTLEFADASVDVVVSVFCIHNIEPAEEQQTACKEIARVLKPGGMAMIADFPGVGGYVEVLRDAGLSVTAPMRAERIALGIAGCLVATKAV